MDTQNKKNVRTPFILAGCGIIAVLMLCGIAAALGAGGAWLAAKQVNRVFDRVTTQIVTGLQANQAKVVPVHGLVEIQGAGGEWTVLNQESLIEPGQTVRTGELSQAQLIFYDGSQTSLGPNSEVSVDKLDFREEDQRRVVELTQQAGESTHDVAHSSNKGSLYAVHTPAGTGVAKGTQFSVSVTPDQATRFNVLEGVVAVTGMEETTQVEAGQATIIVIGQSPSDPALFITGEGVVTQTGDVWVIAGQTFNLHPATVVVGNPQVGDIVFVEGRQNADGTRLADFILLVRKSPTNDFTLTGEVTEIGETAWTVSGQSVTITDTTNIEAGIMEGNQVRVEGIILESGELLAEKITLLSQESGLPFEFEGVVQEINTDHWLISGVEIGVYTGTMIQAGLVVSDLVQVTGRIQEDGTWLADQIKLALDETRSFEITGPLESMSPWKVAGITFETRDWTEISENLQEGELVRVEGQIQPDGTWLAFEIQRVVDLPYPFFVLVGRVISIDPWVVNGIPLNVTEDTIIIGDIIPGTLVRVEINILPDGSWQVLRIISLEDFGHVPVCMHVFATVVSVDGNIVHLLGWPDVTWNGSVSEEGDEDSEDGELTPNSLIQIYLCIDEEGNITIVYITLVTPGNPEVQPPLEGEKVAVCHKPGHKKGGHTLIIGAPAVPAHLAHGDTLGACQP